MGPIAGGFPPALTRFSALGVLFIVLLAREGVPGVNASSDFPTVIPEDVDPSWGKDRSGDGARDHCGLVGPGPGGYTRSKTPNWTSHIKLTQRTRVLIRRSNY